MKQLILIVIFTLTNIISSTIKSFAQLSPTEINIPENTPQRVEESIIQPNVEPPISNPETSTSDSSSLQKTFPNQKNPTDFPNNKPIYVKKIQVCDNTVLKKEINQIVSKYENKYLSFEQLIEIRTKITQLYFEEGYETSGAFLPNAQIPQSGIIKIQVVEGRLEKINIEKLQRLKKSYVRSRLKLATKTPLNIKRLKSALQLLQLNPVVKKINAKLTAGSAPGLNILNVEVQEAAAFHGGIAVANSQSPSIGSVQSSAFIRHDNFVGLGDRLSAEYGFTDGLDIYSIGYSLPVNARNGTFNVRYGNNNSQIIEDTFDDLGIRSESETLSFSYRQPLLRKPTAEFALSVGLDLRHSQTFILNDIPFSFAEGPEDGKSRVSAIRFSQDWVNRSRKTVLAARSQFSFGIDAFDATVNDSGTDGLFFTWLGQFQWVQQISPKTILLTSINAQLTPDSLLSLERFSVGGVNTVRGYRQNQIVSDNGILGVAELRIPITRNPTNLQLNPFLEIGAGWNNRGDNPDSGFIFGAGLGVQWQPFRDLNVRIDYGIPLVPVENEGNSLQENGLYFSLRYQPF